MSIPTVTVAGLLVILGAFWAGSAITRDGRLFARRFEQP